MSFFDKDVGKTSIGAVTSITWHCPGAYLKRRRVIFIRSHADPCLDFPQSLDM